ncbi:MAG: HlyC/CorC family transporter [Spirochaetaceae bacterium]|nr:HlyC/CorC family transporter [Spirochaetaceae bacterium]
MIIWSLVFLVILLIISAFFSSVETAFTSLSPGQINALAQNHGKRGRLVQKLTQRQDILLTTLLIGNNLANIGASAMTTATTIKMIGNAYVAAATGVLTLIILIFCEVSPKQIALVANEKLCLYSARFVLLLSWILKPVIWMITSVSRVITLVLAGREKQKLTLENLLHHVKAAEGQGVVESYEEEMVRNVFRINDTPVEAIMTHRTELFFIDEETSVQDALNLFIESGHTRAPVLKNNIEQVTGVLSLFDLAKVIGDSPGAAIKKFTSTPYMVPGTMKANELFFRLKNAPIHMAVVLDEYGGLDGIITREDVMEEIFGELYDEREIRTADPIRREPDGSWIIQGDTDFYDVADTLGLELEHDNRTHTIGGYLLEKLERIPDEGTVLTLKEGTYTILKTRRQRILSLRFQPIPAVED